MVEWFQGFLNLIKVKPRYLFAILLACSAVLFIPTNVVARLGLDQLREQYRSWLGGATVGTLSLWLVSLWGLWAQGRLRKRYQKTTLRSLDTMSVKERMLFAACLENGQRTIWLEAGDAIGLSLTNKELIEQAGGMGDPLRWPFTIPEFVWNHLQLVGSTLMKDPENPTDEEVRWFHHYKEKLSAKGLFNFRDW